MTEWLGERLGGERENTSNCSCPGVGRSKNGPGFFLCLCSYFCGSFACGDVELDVDGNLYGICVRRRSDIGSAGGSGKSVALRRLRAERRA